MSITGQILLIETTTCSCGNVWQHSRAILTDGSFLGGTPLPLQNKTLPFLQILEIKMPDVFKCFKCIDPTLPKGWQEKETKNKTIIINSPEDLLKL